MNQSKLTNWLHTAPKTPSKTISTPEKEIPTPSRDTASPVTQNRRANLRAACQETKSVLAVILPTIPSFTATQSSKHHRDNLPTLDSKYCPCFRLPAGDPDAGSTGTRIRVRNQDSYDAALEIQPDTTVTTSAAHPRAKRPVAVLNLACERNAGGGWENGAIAQEEALCYRSSLYLSLHRKYYPLKQLGAIYSPNVLMVRDAMSRGHALLIPATAAADLPVTAVISLAALRTPTLSSDGTRFAKASDREFTKEKIRVVLRTAAICGHRKLVLGALGCGAFYNPPEDVALCFLEVLKEQEFEGGWWEDLVFAVLDNATGNQGGKDGIGNYGVFYRALNGVVV